jgi:hypothetical protein
LEGLLIADIKNQEYNLRVFKEGIANLLVVGTATDVEEVDCDWFVVDGDFLNTVVDTDGGDVLGNEFALAVALDDAGLSCLSISY